MTGKVYVTNNPQENVDLDIKMRRRFDSEFVTKYFDRGKELVESDIYHISDVTIILRCSSKYHIRFYGRQDAILEAVSKIENSLELKLDKVEVC